MNQADHDRRSLALHHLLRARLRDETAQVKRARSILRRWLAMDGPRADSATARWSG